MKKYKTVMSSVFCTSPRFLLLWIYTCSLECFASFVTMKNEKIPPPPQLLKSSSGCPHCFKSPKKSPRAKRATYIDFKYVDIYVVNVSCLFIFSNFSYLLTFVFQSQLFVYICIVKFSCLFISMWNSAVCLYLLCEC